MLAVNKNTGKVESCSSNFDNGIAGPLKPRYFVILLLPDKFCYLASNMRDLGEVRNNAGSGDFLTKEIEHPKWFDIAARELKYMARQSK